MADEKRGRERRRLVEAAARPRTSPAAFKSPRRYLPVPDRLAPVSGPHRAPQRRIGPIATVALGATPARPLGFASVLRTAGRAASAPSRWPRHRLGRFASSHGADCPVFGLGSQTGAGRTAPQSGPPAGQRSEGKRISAGPIQESQGQRAKKQGRRTMQAPDARNHPREGIEWARDARRSPCTRKHNSPGQAPAGSTPAPIRSGAGPTAWQIVPGKRPSAARGPADRRRPASRSKAADRLASQMASPNGPAIRTKKSG